MKRFDELKFKSFKNQGKYDGKVWFPNISSKDLFSLQLSHSACNCHQRLNPTSSTMCATKKEKSFSGGLQMKNSKHNKKSRSAVQGSPVQGKVNSSQNGQFGLFRDFGLSTNASYTYWAGPRPQGSKPYKICSFCDRERKKFVIRARNEKNKTLRKFLIKRFHATQDQRLQKQGQHDGNVWFRNISS